MGISTQMAAPLTYGSTQREKLANELPAYRQAARRWRLVSIPKSDWPRPVCVGTKRVSNWQTGLIQPLPKVKRSRGVLIPWERNPHQFFEKNGLEELLHKNLKTTMTNFKLTQCCES